MLLYKTWQVEDLFIRTGGKRCVWVVFAVRRFKTSMFVVIRSVHKRCVEDLNFFLISGGKRCVWVVFPVSGLKSSIFNLQKVAAKDVKVEDLSNVLPL